jgi:hypothetical protein
VFAAAALTAARGLVVVQLETCGTEDPMRATAPISNKANDTEMRNLILENVVRIGGLLQVNLSVETEESYQSIVAI